MKKHVITGFLIVLFLITSHQMVHASSINMKIDLLSNDNTALHRITWTVGDQCAYILTEQGIYTWNDGEPSLRFFAPIYGLAESVNQTKENAALYINHLTYYNGQLYGINTWAGTCMRIAKDVLPASTDVICKFDLSPIYPDANGNSRPQEVRGIIINDTALYMLVDNSKNVSKSNLVGWNLKNGKVQYNIESGDMQAMIPYNTDQAIGITCNQNKVSENAYYGIIDLKSGAFSQLATLPSRNAGGMCFDPGDNRLYIVSKDQLYRSEWSGEWEQINYLSGLQTASSAQGGIVGQKYIFCGYDRLYIRDTQAKPESTAVKVQYIGNTKNNKQRTDVVQ